MMYFSSGHIQKISRQFFNLFNSHDESIKIGSNITETSVDFQDVTKFKRRFSHHNVVNSKMCLKDMDTHETSLFNRNIHLKESWNCNWSDSWLDALTWTTLMKLSLKCSVKNDSTRTDILDKAKF